MLVHQSNGFIIMWIGEWGGKATFSIVRANDRITLVTGDKIYISYKWKKLTGEDFPKVL